MSKIGRAIGLLAIPAAIAVGKMAMDKLAGEPVMVPDAKGAPRVEDSAPLGGEINPDLLDTLVCPEDKGALELVDEGRYLLNPRNGYRYPIRDGIPIMLIEEGRANRVEASVQDD